MIVDTNLGRLGENLDDVTPLLTATFITPRRPVYHNIPLSPPSPRHMEQTEAEREALAETQARAFRRRVTLLIAILIVAVDLPAVLSGSSVTRILENIYCEKYYSQHNPSKIINGKIDEHLCKVEWVQSELSMLKGMGSFFGHLPAFFLAIPYGMAADKYGRKWLLVLNLVSMQCRAIWTYIVCSFPHVLHPKLIWLDAVLSIAGGGGMVATALLFTMLSDVTPTKSMASIFFRLGAANMVCFTVGPPIAAAIMRRDPWIAFSLGVFLQVFSIGITMMIPETLGAKKPGETASTDEKQKVSSPPPYFAGHNSSRLRRWKYTICKLARDNTFLLRDKRVLFLASTYPIRMAMGALDGQLIQYIPQRFHWTMADTTNIQAVQSGVAMIVLLLLLPGLSNWLREKRGYSTTRKDVLLVRLSFAAYAIGTLVTGLAPQVVLLILGITITTFACGCGAAVRALLTNWVRQDEVARLYTALGIIETVGSMIAGPCVAALYNFGLRSSNANNPADRSDVVLGFPWVLEGLALSIIAILTCVVRFTNKDEEAENERRDSTASTVVPDDEDPVFDNVNEKEDVEKADSTTQPFRFGMPGIGLKSKRMKRGYVSVQMEDEKSD